MMKTPAKCIFRKGDAVVLSGLAKRRLRKNIKRRKKGVVVGFSRTKEWCVFVKWIEGDPPIKNRERYAWHFLDFAEEGI